MSRKLTSLTKRLHDIQRELATIESFRPTPQMQQFKRKLFGEYSYVKNQISKLKERSAIKEKDKELKRQKANQNRSAKMKTTWRYFRNIQANYFPDKTLRELRSSFKKHREGLETDIPDIAWRNPSP